MGAIWSPDQEDCVGNLFFELSLADAASIDGVFRRHHVGGNPISFTDPYGLWRFPDYAQFQLDVYVFSVSATYTRYGDIYLGGGVNRAYLNPLSTGVSISDGWVTPKGSDDCDKGSGEPSRNQINDFVNGYSAGGGGYLGVGGTMTFNPAGSATNVGVGFGGFGATPGSVNVYQGNIFGESR